jgi:hypothetical protein
LGFIDGNQCRDPWERQMPQGDRVGFELTFWIEPRNRDEFLQAAESLPSREPGGRTACFERLGAKSRFLWRECWDSRDQLAQRLRSPAIRTLLGAITVLGRVESLEEVELRPGADMSPQTRPEPRGD